MLRNLNELRDYTHTIASKAPAIARRVVLDGPGISDDELARLESLQLPANYVYCIRTLRLLGVVIGYFSLWPGSARAVSLSDALLHANQGDSAAAQLSTTRGFVVVAQEEANPVCVSRSSGNAPDGVFLVDVMSSPNFRIYEIATNFEQFLLLAGNLYRIGRQREASAPDGIREMTDCCAAFACNGEQTKFWASKAEMLLS
jgi:hypothetical protein